MKSLVDTFKSAEIRAAISGLLGVDVRKSPLRMEYSLDTEGFWLEPHVDIPEKLLSMLVYLSDPDHPDPEHWGTDIYKSKTEHFKIVPFIHNTGFLFKPGVNTWHAMDIGKIKRSEVRHSLIINYVSNEWRDTWELS